MRAPPPTLAILDAPDQIRCDAANGGPREVFRADTVRADLLQSRMRADGSWLLQGRAAKAGVLTYTDAAGKPVRELVPDEELSDPESLGTLGRATVTLEHPRPLGTMIDPANVGTFGVGDLDGEVSYDAEGGYVIVSLCVRRADAIDAIRSGKVELSAGYKMTIDPTPGVHPIFGSYDAVQRRRRYNHVAITDTGRAGHDVRLRVDGAGNQIQENPMNPTLLALAALLGLTRTDNEGAILADATGAIGKMKGDAEAMPAAATENEKLKAEVARLTSELAQAVANLRAAETAGGADAIAEQIGAACDAPAMTPVELEAMPEAPPAAMVIKTDARRHDSIRKVVRTRGADRARMERVATSLRVDAAEVAKLGDAALRKKLVTTAHPSARTDADTAYYAARFDAMCETERVDATDSDPFAAMSRAAQARLDAVAAGGTRADAAETKRPATMAEASLASIRKLQAAPAAE